MSPDPLDSPSGDWRRQLPLLVSRSVTLREAAQADVASLVEILNACDATRFGLEGAADQPHVVALIERWASDQAAGTAINYVIVSNTVVVGLVQVRQLNPRFEAAEWEIAIRRTHQGTGLFLDAARLVIGFVFGTLGTHRLEARVLVLNGRAMGAMRKLGAVQEGLLRRSMRRGDQYLDQVLWSILNDDWLARQATVNPRVH